MAHIELGNEFPGIRGLLAYRPETAAPLTGLCEVLLRGEHSLSRGERELIAAYVSRLNECDFCTNSHGACAAAQLPGGAAHVERVLAQAPEAGAGDGARGTADGLTAGGPRGDGVSGKLAALLDIAALVRVSGRMVTEAAVAAAREQGASDAEIHDTVLIAAAFCMLNRYVDGLAAPTPDDPELYAAMADRLVKHGYQPPR